MQQWWDLDREEQAALAEVGLRCDNCKDQDQPSPTQQGRVGRRQQRRLQEPTRSAATRQHAAINQMVADRIYNDMMSK